MGTSVRRFTYDVPTVDLGTDGRDITVEITDKGNKDGIERKVTKNEIWDRKERILVKIFIRLVCRNF